MSLSSSQAKTTRRLLAKASVALVLLAAVGLLILATAPKRHADDRHLFVPESWRGTWEVTVAYRDQETGALVATDITTTTICPGEPIAPPLLNTFLQLSGEANDNSINLSVRAHHAPQPGCNLFVEVRFTSRLEDDTWSGTGSWSASLVGNCKHRKFGEDFVVSGRRLSREAMCDDEPTSLVERFFTHSLLTPILVGRD